MGRSHDGDIKNMSMHSFVWFVILLVLIGFIGLIVVFRLCHQCSMSPQEVKKKLETSEMLEMQDLLVERQYDGRVMLPVGC